MSASHHTCRSFQSDDARSRDKTWARHARNEDLQIEHQINVYMQHRLTIILSQIAVSRGIELALVAERAGRLSSSVDQVGTETWRLLHRRRCETTRVVGEDALRVYGGAVGVEVAAKIVGCRSIWIVHVSGAV